MKAALRLIYPHLGRSCLAKLDLTRSLTFFMRELTYDPG